MDGVGSVKKANVLVIGATNRPFDLDEAALRRLTKRIYIGLPDKEARKGQIAKLLKTVSHKINKAQMETIVELTQGYSSADLTALVKEVAMHPVRELEPGAILQMRKEDIRPVKIKDFENSIKVIRPSVSAKSIMEYTKWHKLT